MHRCPLPGEIRHAQQPVKAVWALTASGDSPLVQVPGTHAFLKGESEFHTHCQVLKCPWYAV